MTLPPFIAEMFPGLMAVVVGGLGWIAAKYTAKHAYDKRD
jgi:hypothetical protein